MLKRLLTLSAAIVTTVSLMVIQLPAANVHALEFAPNCTVNSEAAALYNIDTDTLVYAKNADKKEMPAALVQIMTAVIVLESCSDISGQAVTATSEMFAPFKNYEYQSDLRYAQIDAGNTLSVEDLLYAMMLTSSCEASVMLATAFGGENDFVRKMNDKAAELGMTNTRFTNATGLYSARQVSTARDMMTLLKYAFTVPRFEAIACASSYKPSTAESAGKGDKWLWEHSNIMMDSKSEYACNGVRGVKTGNLQEGGRSIALKASRDGVNYLLVCMNAPLRDEDNKAKFYHLIDAKGILEWAFMHLSYREILPASQELGEIRVTNASGDDYVILHPAQGFSCMWCDTMATTGVQQIKDWPLEVEAPVQAGDKLGKVTLKFSGETIAEIDVIAASTVERSFWKYNLSQIPGFFRSDHLHNMWIWGILLSIVYVGACVFFAIRYRIKFKDQRAAAKKRR